MEEGGQYESGCARCVEPRISSNTVIRSQEQMSHLPASFLSSVTGILPQAHGFPLKSHGTLSLAYLCWECLLNLPPHLPENKSASFLTCSQLSSIKTSELV